MNQVFKSNNKILLKIKYKIYFIQICKNSKVIKRQLNKVFY